MKKGDYQFELFEDPNNDVCCNVRFVSVHGDSSTVEEQRGLKWINCLEYPLLPYRIIESLSPIRTCVCLKPGDGFSRHLIKKLKYMLHFDFGMYQSVMSENLLHIDTPRLPYPQGPKEIEVPIEGRKILISQIAIVRMHGLKFDEIIEVTVGIIEKSEDRSFDHNRIILGGGQLKKILASIGPPPLDSSFDGMYVLKSTTGCYFEITYEMKRETKKKE